MDLTTKRACIIALACVALSAGGLQGCGDGDGPTDESKEPRSAPRTQTVTAAPGTAEAVARLPAARRARLARAVAGTVLEDLGLASSAIVVSRDGNRLRAQLDPSRACTATPDTEGRALAALRRAMPWLQSVRISVGKTGQTLSHYARTSCG